MSSMALQVKRSSCVAILLIACVSASSLSFLQRYVAARNVPAAKSPLSESSQTPAYRDSEGGASDSAFAALHDDQQNQSIEAEVISIRPSGFEPTQIARPKGPFLLVIENRSELEEIDFQLGVEGATPLFQVKRSWEDADWSQVIDLTTGQYVLTESNHPDWKCTITITEQ